MIQCSKQYKQITDKAYNNYQFRLENELRTTSKTNSKEFWKILNSFLKKNKENDKDISMEVLYNYFENLSRNNFDDGNIDIDIDVNNLQR
jgi:ribosomal protein L18E